MLNKTLMKLTFSIIFVFFIFEGSFSLANFDPNRIKILIRTDLDIVYHTLAHLDLLKSSSKLFSQSYLKEIRQAKEDLKIGMTRLDRERDTLRIIYHKYSKLRFLYKAPFIADDFSSFKQALKLIDYNFRIQSTQSERKGEERKLPLIFGNSQRLIPIFQKHFSTKTERDFVKKFAACLDEEFVNFYQLYREARMELDQGSIELFSEFWKTKGLKILWPWAFYSGAKEFKIYLSPVMYRNGLRQQLIEGSDLSFFVVAPLPKTLSEAIHSFFVILQQTVHRSTDDLVILGSSPNQNERTASLNKIRENASIYAGHLYLKVRFPEYHQSYLRFFVEKGTNEKIESEDLEDTLIQKYAVNETSLRQIENFVNQLIHNTHFN